MKIRRLNIKINSLLFGVETLFYIVFFATFSIECFAQQIPMYSQWSYHQMSINPAHSGIKNCIDVHALYRIQWLGLNDAPRSGLLTASFPLASKRNVYLSARHGLGLRFEADRIGLFDIHRFNVSYAGHFNFSEYDRLSLGLYVGVVQLGFDRGRSRTIVADPAIMHELTTLRPDAHFGAWWNSKNFYFGLMINQLFGSYWQDRLSSKFRFHTAINGGYRFVLKNNIGLIPSAMIRIPTGATIHIDAHLNADFNNKFQLGLGFRSQDAAIFSAGIKINDQFSIIYSFDYTISTLNKVSNNTHELSFSFLTCKPERTSTYSCPLFE